MIHLVYDGDSNTQSWDKEFYNLSHKIKLSIFFRPKTLCTHIRSKMTQYKMMQFKRRDGHLASKPGKEMPLTTYNPDIGYETVAVKKVRDFDKIVAPKSLVDVCRKSLSSVENAIDPSLYMLDSSNAIQVTPSSNVVLGLGACQRTTKLLERQKEIIREIRMNPPPPPPPPLLVPIPNEILIQMQASSNSNTPNKKLNGRSHPWDIPPRTNTISSYN